MLYGKWYIDPRTTLQSSPDRIRYRAELELPADGVRVLRYGRESAPWAGPRLGARHGSGHEAALTQSVGGSGVPQAGEPVISGGPIGPVAPAVSDEALPEQRPQRRWQQ